MKQLRQQQVGALSAISLAVKGIICLPTGTGKSVIITESIAQAIVSNPTTGVYLILAPRILLADQLLKGLQDDLQEKGIDVQLLLVRSGTKIDTNDMEFVVYRDIVSTTSSRKIHEDYLRARRENVPLIIFSTYNSADRIIQAGVPINVTYCDEAHHIVTNEFQHIATDSFPSEHKYFFTATTRETSSDNGLGMNNDNRFGEVIFYKSPREMVQAGEIVAPRMHLIAATGSLAVDEDSIDGAAIIEAFREHTSMINVGAKLLITTKGTEHLSKLVSHEAIQRLPNIRPRLKVYDITSEYGPRINGAPVRRDEFLKSLRALSDTDEALVFHIDILTEGIDVSSFTAVMPLNGQGKAKFLQTLGRATRLHIEDRKKIYAGAIDPSSKNFKPENAMIKPYAWVIVPTYGEMGEDLQDQIRDMIYELRDFGFEPSEHVFVRQNKGKPIPVSVAGINELDTKTQSLLDFFGDIVHDIEEEQEAAKIYEIVTKAKTAREMINGLLDFE